MAPHDPGVPSTPAGTHADTGHCAALPTAGRTGRPVLSPGYDNAGPALIQGAAAGSYEWPGKIIREDKADGTIGHRFPEQG